MKKLKLSLLGLLCFSLLLPVNHKGVVLAADTTPGVNFTVKPAQAEVVKPSSGNAEGALDINLAPTGSTTTANRKPMDVVFIFDKSASMDELGNNPAKFKSAKDAMLAAITYFKQNAGPNDRFSFIAFDTDIDKMVLFSPTNNQVGLEEIRTAVNNLTVSTLTSNSTTGYVDGLTNYTQPFQKAAEWLQTSTNPKKNIVFMTDGVPTFSYNNETVQGSTQKVSYLAINKSLARKSYINSSSKLVTLSTDYTTIESAIRKQINSQVTNLASNKINLYSIGFGSEADVDNNYLRDLSTLTGATARQATESNISNVFRDISANIDTPSISGEVKINLSKYNGKVNIADGANARIDSNGVATINFSVNYPLNQGTPSAIDLKLPLTFSQTGTYTFDDIKLSYSDLDGKAVTKSHTPVSIVVKDDAPPTFRGTMDLTGVVNTPDNLIKYTTNPTANTDLFRVNYTLTPQGLVNSSVAGTLSNITLIQPLPDGMTLFDTTNARIVTLADGRKAAQITLANVAYASGKFTPTALTATLNLKVNWAMNNVKLPVATVNYTDSRFGARTTTISPSNTVINLKVRLPEFPDNSYDGDAGGMVSKLNLTSGILLSQSEFPNSYGLSNKAIKDMNYLNGSLGRTIEITYFDDTKAYIYLVPDFELKGKSTGNLYQSGAVSEEDVLMKLTNLVPGKNVKYYYSVNATGDTGWTEFTPTDGIAISKLGLNNVKVKAEGGFALSNLVTEKQITIIRKVQSVTVQPNPIELETGKTANVTITVSPADATNQELTITVSDPTVAVRNGNQILGVKEGQTKLVVETKDGSNIRVEVPIKVTDPYVALKEVKFKNTVFTLVEGDVVALKDYVIFNPANATYKELSNAKSSVSNKVEVFLENNQWKLRAVDAGYSTVTIEAMDPKVKQLLTDSALFNVVEEGNNDNADTTSSTDGKW